MNQMQRLAQYVGYHGANVAQGKTDIEDAVANFSVASAAYREAFQQLATTNVQIHTNLTNIQAEYDDLK